MQDIVLNDFFNFYWGNIFAIFTKFFGAQYKKLSERSMCYWHGRNHSKQSDDQSDGRARAIRSRKNVALTGTYSRPKRRKRSRSGQSAPTMPINCHASL